MSDPKLHEKIDKLDERLDSIDIHLAKYNAQLEYHIDRTDRLETFVVESQAEVKEDLKPLKAHVEQWSGAGQLVKWTSIGVGIVTSIIGAIMYWIRP